MKASNRLRGSNLMRGKPFLAAAVAFLLVFLGGAAIAGVSGFSPQRVEAPQSAGSDDVPHESTTSTSTTTITTTSSSTTSVKTGDDGRRTTDDGAETEAVEKAERDTAPPRFEILYPDNPSRTDGATAVIGGHVELGAKVILGDRRARVDGEDWKIEVELRPGWNELKFHAFDEAGNVTRRGIAIFRVVDEDTTPPRFVISSPSDGAEVHDKTIVVRGQVEEGATVIFGDRRAHVDGQEWKIEVELALGKNVLGFKAVDEAGNATRRSITVSYVREGDTTPPRFAITSPSDGSESHEHVIIVSGGVEPGAKVFYGDRAAQVEGDAWKIEVELEKGENVLTFKAYDAAGNRTKRSITVHYVREGDTEPPRFTITSPANESETDDRVVVVGGGVEPGAKVYYGERAAHVEGDDWRIEVELEKGKNVLYFKAYDEAGNWTKRTVTVYYIGEGEPRYEFSAIQKYGSCGEDAPYDVFHGTGKPGSVIEVGSEYGGGRVEVGESGEWKIKVYFEGSPLGEPFRVSVHASTGEEAHFTFINTGSKPDEGGGEHDA
jgi:hypothetical protein